MGEHCGEIVTLQLGHYSNCVGSHWWNLQNPLLSHNQNPDPQICSDVLFRRGETLKRQETYTPRLILLDLKDSLCPVQLEGCLYEDKETTHSTPAWKGGLTTHQEEPTQSNLFLEHIVTRSQTEIDSENNSRVTGHGVGNPVRKGTVSGITGGRAQCQGSREAGVGDHGRQVSGITGGRCRGSREAGVGDHGRQVSGIPRGRARCRGFREAGHSVGDPGRQCAVLGILCLLTMRVVLIIDPVTEVVGGDPRSIHNLERSLSTWSDFLQTNLHPKSACAVSHCSHGGEAHGLESFAQGLEILKDPTYLEMMEDRLHFFTEECDYLQGFQILCDLHSGFSGVGAQLTELLHDEYSGRGVLSWGSFPVPSSSRDIQRGMIQTMNSIMGIVRMSSLSSLFSPLTLSSSLGCRPGPPTPLPNLLYDAEVQYQSSAVLAVALDTLTAPYRMPSSPLSMVDLAEALTFCGRKVVATFSSLPFPIGCGCCLPDALLPHVTSAPWCSLSACGNINGSQRARCFSQSVVLRGVGTIKQSSNLGSDVRPRTALHSQATGQDVLQCYFQKLYPDTVSISHLLAAPCRLGSSFPQFFSPHVSEEGFMLEGASNQPSSVESVPVLTALQASEALHPMLRSLYTEVKRGDLRRYASFFTSGLEQDEWEEALHQLQSLTQCYRHDMQTDEDEE
ncbi:protein misato homolog 1 [Pelodytes ibericus]